MPQTAKHRFQRVARFIATKAGYWFVTSTLVLMTACSGDSNPEPVPTPLSPDVATVFINPGEIALPSLAYSLVTSNGQVGVFNGESGQVEVKELVGSEREILMIVNEINKPVMVKFRTSGDSSGAINMDTTAVGFLMASPVMAMLDLTAENFLKINQQIVNNSNYQLLKESLKTQIEQGSICPLDHNCAAYSSYIADQIIQSINY